MDALDEQHGIYYSVLFVPDACVQGQQLLLAAHSTGYIRCVVSPPTCCCDYLLVAADRPLPCCTAGS